MTEPRPDLKIHQAFFGWSHDTGNLTVLSHSFSRPDPAMRWLKRLEPHLRLQPVPGTNLPPYALSYFDYNDGSVAVLRRVDAGYSLGRNNSYALIGSAEALGIPVALALGDWGGWLDWPGPDAMTPLNVTDLPNPQEAVAKRLRPQAERLERPLGAVLTQILDHPGVPLSIIGCRDEDRLAMVWGLRGAADDYLRQRGLRRAWSFSTYEDRHDVSIAGLPEVVFLPVRPAGAAVVRRAIVELDREPPPSPNAALAGELVARLLHGTPLRIQEPGDIGMPVGDRQSPPQRVRCPICADDIDWPNKLVIFDEKKGAYEERHISGLNPRKQADLLRKGYRQCPNPSQDTAEHYLPATYASYKNPLVIGLVGAPDSGKTHLLTAMIRQAHRGGLREYGVEASALDIRRHDEFERLFIDPFEKGGALPGTGVGRIEAADILLLRGPGGERPVTFFDVAGEDLESTAADNIATRFLVGADAVIFVYASEDSSEAKRKNRSFDLAVERLLDQPKGDGLPAVIALMKSDRLRYVPPADRWLRRVDGGVVDAARFRAESRDVYSYLYRIGAEASLRPYETFTRCTLHFVSASGGDAIPLKSGGEDPKQEYFPRGIRPTRVLEPLVSILAMTGMITGREAEKVGVP